ncbi:MAG TPA: hypothetical protein VGS19_29945 [Streptosporangiaceae bacterium]|nr:hypothetical protein [Streptosporangiaceae bacterium]
MLDTIAVKLAESDPRLASLFAIFTRLNRAESMPWFEQLKPRLMMDRLAVVGTRLGLMSRKPAARVRALVVLPAALTAMVCALTISFGLTGGHRPAPWAKMPTARTLIVKPRLCAMNLRLGIC